MPASPRLSELFLEAARLSPSAVAGFLDGLPPPDRPLRADLERLLDADRRNADGFLLSSPPVPEAGEHTEPWTHPAPLPSPFAGYTPLSLIGESEHAAVYLATRDGPLDASTTVALKVIRAHSAAGAVLRRFEQERRIIALMDHPNVARLLATGTTPDGRAYLAVEHVPGLPLTAFARSEHLSLRERLRLFADACRGVEHAHQRGIIHRDLKPSNILAARTPGAVAVKVIDFGISKAIGASSLATTMTRPGQFLGTVPYMSPEQVRSDPRIDTRTDVYSMGAVLYELLTGTPLVDAGACGPVTVIDQILKTEAPRPSALVRAARGDLDTITRTALAKDPARRYPSVAALRQDIERYLDALPIVARPPSQAYIARKFISRHRLLTTVVLVGASALIITAARAWQAQQQRFDVAVEVARTWFDEIRAMAKDADFRAKRSPLLHRLDAASAALLEQSPASPGVRRLRADVLVAAGDLDLEDGRAPEALERFERALAIRAALAAARPTDPDLRTDVSIATVRCGDAARELHNDERALALYQRARVLDEETYAQTPHSARAITVLGWSYDRLGTFAEGREGPAAAAALYQKELALFRRLARLERSPDAERAVASAETHLALTLGRDDPALAAEMFTRAIAHADEAARLGPGDRLALAARVSTRLCFIHTQIAQPGETYPDQRIAEALAMARSMAAQDPGDPITRHHFADALHFAGHAALRSGDPAGAAELFTEQARECRALLALRPKDGAELARTERARADLATAGSLPPPEKKKPARP